MTPNIDPVCGVVMEPRNAPAEDNTKLRDMARRFWVSAVLAHRFFAGNGGRSFSVRDTGRARAGVADAVLRSQRLRVDKDLCFEHALVKARYSPAATILVSKCSVSQSH